MRSLTKLILVVAAGAAWSPAMADTKHCGSIEADLDLIESKQVSMAHYENTIRVRWGLEKGESNGKDHHGVEVNFDLVDSAGTKIRDRIVEDFRYGRRTNEYKVTVRSPKELTRVYLTDIKCIWGDR